MSNLITVPAIAVEGSSLALATLRAWDACDAGGFRTFNVKHTVGEALARDASILVHVPVSFREPLLFTPGIPGDPEAVWEYVLEVVFGVWNHWVGHGWDYTYNQRLARQIPRMLSRIEKTWLEKGRITGRDFQLVTWRAANDQRIDDPPCLQNLHLRLVPCGEPGHYSVNLTVLFRSRDLGNAFNMNAFAFIHWQKVLMDRIARRMKKYGLTFSMGSYTDFSISLHLYGADEERRNLEKTLLKIREQDPTRFCMDSRFYIPTETRQKVNHRVAAQVAFEKLTRGQPDHSFKATPEVMAARGINWKNFPYPPRWNIELPVYSG